ncbi:Retrovirus-related Pol polyprotein from transposon RE2 [Bienertia sinuspersici]
MQKSEEFDDNPLSASINFAGTSSISNVDSLSHVIDKNSWTIDTRASDHIASNLILFASITQLKNSIKVSLPDGTINLFKHVGTVHLNPNVCLTNVLYIPQFKHNLLSVGKLLDHNNLLAILSQIHVLFRTLQLSKSRLMEPDIQVYIDFLQLLPTNKFSSNVSHSMFNNTITSNTQPSLDIIHARLGHPSLNTLKHMSVSSLGNNTSSDFTCEACVFGNIISFLIPYLLLMLLMLLS